MTDKAPSLSSSTVRSLRIAALSAGFIMLAVAFLADLIGVSAGTGIGRGQVILGLLGLTAILGGLLGPGFFSLYKAVGGILLVLISLLLATEVISSAILLLASIGDEKEVGRFVLSFEDTDSTEYASFTGWRSRDPDPVLPGETILLGGSALALPSGHDGSGPLAAALTEMAGRSLSDQSQPYYNTGQALVTLMLLLRDGSEPGSVILVSGPGDILSALSTGTPSDPIGTDEFRELTWTGEGVAVNLEELFRNAEYDSRAMFSIQSLFDQRQELQGSTYDPFSLDTDRYSDAELEQLATAIADRMDMYCETLEALSEEFSFSVSVIWLGQEDFSEVLEHPLYRLYTKTDRLMEDLAADTDNLFLVSYTATENPSQVGSGFAGLFSDQAQAISEHVVRIN